MSQTTIQQEKAIRKGSVRIKIGNDFNSLVDIGAIRDPKMTMMVEQQNIEFDNVNDLRQFAEGDKVQFSFVLAEINLTNLAQFDKGLVNLTNVAGTIVNNHSQVVASGDWAYNKFIPFEYQNGDGSAITPDSVTAGTNGLLVSETDYFITNVNGVRGIIVKDSATVTTLVQTITIVFDYTPNASKKITFTKIGTKELIVCRIENTDADGKVFKIDFEDVTNVVAPAIDFPADDEAEIATMPMTLEGYVVEITDEQQVL
jgi:hypothetical protein